MGHRIDFNVFVNMYNKYINYELWFKKIPSWR
jgi:hypothetical protein